MILGACRLSGIQGWQAKLGTLISHCFPASIQQGGGSAAFSAHTIRYFSPPHPPSKFRVEGNNFLTLATIHYVYGSAPHPIPPLFPVLMKGKNVLLSFFIFPDW